MSSAIAGSWYRNDHPLRAAPSPDMTQQRSSSRDIKQFSAYSIAIVLTMAACLSACSPEPASINPATTNTAALPKDDSDNEHLLATWQSFSYNPPQYAVETLLIYNDFSCTITAADRPQKNLCHWQRDANQQLSFSFPNSSAVITARLRPAKSIEGKKQPYTAGYLLANLADSRQQIFVLAGSADADMVREAIDGESLWNAGQRQQGVAKLGSALQLGSTWARLRLGWLHATTQEFLQPALAVQLLFPLRENQSFPVQNALAAAYAANGEYPKAVEHATLACSLTIGEQQANCEQRLTLYRNNQPFVITPATD